MYAMLRLKRHHAVPSLCVHDSLIVPVSKQNLAEDLLRKGYRVHAGGHEPVLRAHTFPGLPSSTDGLLLAHRSKIVELLKARVEQLSGREKALKIIGLTLRPQSKIVELLKVRVEELSTLERALETPSRHCNTEAAAEPPKHEPGLWDF